MKIIPVKLFAALIIIAAALTMSCSKDNKVNTNGLYVPSQADVTSSATLQELQQGRVLYIDNCAACHNLYSPDDYSASQWPQVLSGMAPRAGLSSANTLLVKKYLTKGK
jgi:mono/diheme cytochrome c family protein